MPMNALDIQDRSMPDSKMPQPGEKAPSFEMPAHPGGTIKLSQFRSRKNVVLYFYPRDNTPGCTKEACGFRDQYKHVDASDTVVLGVSTDSVKSHEKFAEKFELPFPLIADEKHELCEKYGVWVEKTNYGKKSMGVQRATFLIDKTGKIVRVWEKVKPEEHAEEVKAALAELE